MNKHRTSFARRFSLALSCSALLALPTFFGAASARAADAGSADLAPLPLKLPDPAYAGTPKKLPADTTALKPTGKPRAPFMAPKGTTNVALNKPVTSSDKLPISGSLELITDGRKQGFSENVVMLRRRTQWVQIDLEKPCDIYAVILWHEHGSPMVYRDVVVQVADDPDFVENVRTIFNNDQDNSSGLGVGKDREYFENYEGKLVDANGVKARYVRCYSKGSTDSALNAYTEIEVWGLPAK